MGKIKAVFVAINTMNKMTVIDDMGRVWSQDMNGWQMQVLPDDPGVVMPVVPAPDSTPL
jgi:hypothetical protein